MYKGETHNICATFVQINLGRMSIFLDLRELGWGV